MSDTDQQPRGLRRTFQSLGYRDYRLFWISGLISNTGRFFQVLALPIIIWELTSDPRWVGFTGFAQFIPMALIAPVAGPIADRFPRRKVLLVTQSLMLAFSMVFAVMWWSGIKSPWAYAGVALFAGTSAGLNLPAWQAFVSELVPRNLMLNAITLNSAQFNSSRLAGPVLAGITIASAGPGTAFTVNAVSFLAVIGALLLMRTPGTIKPNPKPMRPIHDMFDTMRYIRTRPGIDIAIATVSLVGFSGLSIQVLSVIFAEENFDQGPEGYGLMLTMLGVGTVICVPFVASLGDWMPRSKIQAVSLCVYGLALLSLALSPTFFLALVSMAFVGAAHLTTASTLNTTVQLQVDEEGRRAQVLAVYMMALLFSAPLGQLVLGQLIDVIGTRPTFALSGAALLAATLALILSGRLKRFDCEDGVYEPDVFPEVHPTTPAPPCPRPT